MHHNNKYVRNQLIYDQYVHDGRTSQSIADEHGLCQQRISQIVAKEKRKIFRQPPNYVLKELLPLKAFLIELAETPIQS
jgi:hypothetical protein